jgi:hypothetical protein
MLGILFWSVQSRGIRFSTSQRNDSFYCVSAWNSRYKQNYFLLFSEFNLVSTGRRSNSITMIHAILWDALANFKQCTTGNVSKVSAITMLVVRSPKESTPKNTTLIKKQMSLWRNKFNSETVAQGKQKHELRIFRSFDCQSVTHTLPDT